MASPGVYVAKLADSLQNGTDSLRFRPLIEDGGLDRHVMVEEDPGSRGRRLSAGLPACRPTRPGREQSAQRQGRGLTGLPAAGSGGL